MFWFATLSGGQLGFHSDQVRSATAFVSMMLIELKNGTTYRVSISDNEPSASDLLSIMRSREISDNHRV